MLRRSLCYPKSDTCGGSRWAQKVLESGFDPGARVQVVAEGVAHKIEAEHRQHDGNCRSQNEMRGVEEMSAPVVEHRTPACRWRRYAEAEKAHGGFGQNRARHSDGSLHNHRLNDIRQDVADDDAQVASTECAGGLNKLALARSKHLAANQT